METTRLSSKGQIIIPKSIRQTHQWTMGQEFIVEETRNGILLRPKQPFPETAVQAVAGCLKYDGAPKSVEEMTDAISRGVQEQWHDLS
ncbi:MAG: AbrB/MazE/SpoVT family DNA-binding domain-containing protein [Thermosynechococcaceae cyanobacterium]